jgi:hypothetical protein
MHSLFSTSTQLEVIKDNMDSRAWLQRSIKMSRVRFYPSFVPLRRLRLILYPSKELRPEINQFKAQSGSQTLARSSSPSKPIASSSHGGPPGNIRVASSSTATATPMSSVSPAKRSTVTIDSSDEEEDTPAVRRARVAEAAQARAKKAPLKRDDSIIIID